MGLYNFLKWWTDRAGWIWHNIIKWILLAILAVIAFILLNIIGVMIVAIYHRKYVIWKATKWIGWTFFKLPIKQYRYGRRKWKLKLQDTEEAEFFA